MKKKLEVTKEEYDLIKFYRDLSEDKKVKFLKLIGSLKKILLDDKDS